MPPSHPYPNGVLFPPVRLAELAKKSVILADDSSSGPELDTKLLACFAANASVGLTRFHLSLIFTSIMTSIFRSSNSMTLCIVLFDARI